MSSPKARIISIDLLRGLVMLIMALDHARDYLHLDFFRGNDPLDFATTSTPLFLTRWITHFCAPVFVFLAGASIFFSGIKTDKKSLSLFLLKRGLWLVAIEIIVITFGWTFDPGYHLIVLQVIWAIGLSMVCMSLIVFLPKAIILLAGLALVFGHNLLDVYDKLPNTLSGFVWAVLHVQKLFMIDATHRIVVVYPLIPWLGLMMLGYVFATLYLPDIKKTKRRNVLTALGAGCMLLFVLLRFGNIYGEPENWEVQKTTTFTFLSFINTTKYPPSLLYLLMTIGPSLLFLAFAENLKGWWVRATVIFGRVPFFYYIVHIYLLHIIAGILFFASGHTLADLNFPGNTVTIPPDFGFHLWQVYIIWMVALALLYFPCKWYNNYKSTHNYWWLSYL
jgi:uncharacterized membrane protein